jgi:hypothetical protein
LTRGVVVLGMHRSGTSAATRLASLVGLSLGRGQMVPVTDGNPRGHWESLRLRDVNDAVLAAFGGNWAGPPPLEPGWERGPDLDPLRVEMRGAFAEVYRATDQWVWKDPRNCITLPFWEQALDVEPVVLLVHRNPLEVVDSLGRRDEFSKAVSLALWERYVRDSLRNSDGHPVHVSSAEEVLGDPAAWATQVREVLVSHGWDLPARPGDREAFVHAVDTGLRHARASQADLAGDPDVSDAQRALLDVLEKVAGYSDRFAAPELPLATPGIDRLLIEHARFYEERETLREKLARAREYDDRIINVRRLKIRVYALYRQLVRGGRSG